MVPIADVIRFYQPYVWGTWKWEHAYGRRNLVETANSLMRDHFGRLAKGTFKVLGQLKMSLADAFLTFAVNTRLMVAMTRRDYERWTGEPDPFIPELEDPIWGLADHEPLSPRAGPAKPANPSPRPASERTTS